MSVRLTLDEALRTCSEAKTVDSQELLELLNKESSIQLEELPDDLTNCEFPWRRYYAAEKLVLESDLDYFIIPGLRQRSSQFFPGMWWWDVFFYLLPRIKTIGTIAELVTPIDGKIEAADLGCGKNEFSYRTEGYLTWAFPEADVCFTGFNYKIDKMLDRNQIVGTVVEWDFLKDPITKRFTYVFMNSPDYALGATHSFNTTEFCQNRLAKLLDQRGSFIYQDVLNNRYGLMAMGLIESGFAVAFVDKPDDYYVSPCYAEKSPPYIVVARFQC